MAISINSDDKLWVKSLFTAFLTAAVIPVAGANVKQKADFEAAIAAANTAAQAVA